jgi:sugar phosphate isomerase/epimerase
MDERFAFNQATAKYWAMDELIAGCVASGVRHVGLWRENVADHGLDRTAKEVRAAGLSVSTLCRSGFFEREGWFDDNRRAIDEAATLGTGILVLVSGGLPEGSRDIAGARRHVADAVAALVPHAVAAGVTLAVEPLHPMFASDRCVISTFGQAMAIASQHPVGAVGVCVDTYHLWWDDTVLPALAAAGPRVTTYQLADWITPLPHGALTGRGLPGQGCVDFTAFHSAVEEAGYTGPIEVEIFNDALWARPGAEILADTITAFHNVVVTDVVPS